MSFKDSVHADNRNVFLNTSEFAEPHTIKYNGNVYTDIPVLLTKIKERKRTVLANDHGEGIHLVGVVAHIDLSDLGFIIPEQGRPIEIDDGEALGEKFYQRYYIVTSDCEMDMITLELEAFDE